MTEFFNGLFIFFRSLFVLFNNFLSYVFDSNLQMLGTPVYVWIILIFISSTVIVSLFDRG